MNLTKDQVKTLREEYKKYYIEGKNNINGNNIEIYINNKKIEFNYKYKSNEKGEIKVKFIFNKLLTSTFCMFHQCYSLIIIDLSSFITTNVNNMSCMFNGCSSLKSIDLSSFNTTNVNNTGCMFFGCFSLKKENVKINIFERKILSQLNKDLK